MLEEICDYCEQYYCECFDYRDYDDAYHILALNLYDDEEDLENVGQEA